MQADASLWRGEPTNKGGLGGGGDSSGEKEVGTEAVAMAVGEMAEAVGRKRQGEG